MLKKTFIFCFSIIFICRNAVNAQNFSSEVPELFSGEVIMRDPVKFTHVPVFLLRLAPQHVFRYDNMFVGGLEVSPPVGKFSFVFDYGKGKGSNSLQKDIRKLFSENYSKMLRGEIRTYFSDWFPFYALDKKPFGRYYALEYQHLEANRFLTDNLTSTYNYIERRQDLRVKLGRHIHFHRHFFIDLNAGLGLGRVKIISEFEPSVFENIILKEPNFFSRNLVSGPLEKNRFRFSSTINLNLVFPI